MHICMCVSLYVRAVKAVEFVKQHAASDHWYVGTQAVNLGVVT